MCLRYACHKCRATHIIYCASADWIEVEPACPYLKSGIQDDIRQKCYHCKVVEGAIRELRRLVFYQPWLETEGQIGSQNREAWETAQVAEPQMPFIDWNQQEDHELANRLRAMGLDQLDGERNLNEGHGLANGSDLTPHNQDGTTSNDNIEQVSVWGSDEGTLNTEGSEGSMAKEGAKATIEEEDEDEDEDEQK